MIMAHKEVYDREVLKRAEAATQKAEHAQVRAATAAAKAAAKKAAAKNKPRR